MARSIRQQATQYVAKRQGRGTATQGRGLAGLPFVVVLVAILAVCLVFLILYRSQLAEEQRLSERQRVLASELADAEAKRAAIEDRLAALDSDDFVEELARGQLGMVRENEILFVDGEERAEDVADSALRPSPTPTTSTAESADAPAEP